MGDQQLLTPGQDWLAIIRRPTQAAFASAFTDDVILDTAVTNEPIRGTVALRNFFDATRAMYDTNSFVHEMNAGSRTCLEWEGRFQEHSNATGSLAEILFTKRAGVRRYERDAFRSDERFGARGNGAQSFVVQTLKSQLPGLRSIAATG